MKTTTTNQEATGTQTIANQGATTMKTTTTATIAIALALLIPACAVETGDENDEDIYSEEESELGGLTCVTTGNGSGTCTAASAPSGWTIKSARGAINMKVTSTGPTTASWSCGGSVRSPATATVTATGVGSALVACGI